MSGLSERQRAQLRAAQRRGYRTKPGRMDTLPANRWIGVAEAGELLQVSDRRLAMLMQTRQLLPAHSLGGEAGFHRDSVDALVREREGASWTQRMGYLLRDTLRMLTWSV